MKFLLPLTLMLIPLAKSKYIEIVSREDWHANSPDSTEPLSVNPAPYVVIHHSATRGCNDTEECKKLIKSFQNYHMDSQRWADIGYNFLISEDGTIYEGRGWGVSGAHARGYNDKSIGICFIGLYTDKIPSDRAMNSMQNLIEYGIDSQLIDIGYKLIGHRQGSATECPGNALYNLIQTLPAWTENI